MVKTLTSIFVSLALIAGISYYETWKVRSVFRDFREILFSLKDKTESRTANYPDGEAVRSFWNEKKRSLHIWVSHTSIENVDYQLNEALGYLYEKKFDDALPKIEVLIEITNRIPLIYSVRPENVL